MNKNSDESGGKPRIPMRRRLRAWWQGEELSLRSAYEEEESPTGGPKRHVERLDLLQEIWGKENEGPGTSEYIERLVKPLGLNPALTVVDLGTGLGTTARVMVQAFGVWVQGLESNKASAEAGMEISEMSGMGKKAAIEYFVPESHVYRKNVADAILAREFFHKTRDKPRVLQGVNLLLRDKGQLLLTDFMLPDDSNPEEVAPWISRLDYPIELWSETQYLDALRELWFDVRINEDMTDQFEDLITHAWSDFTSLQRISGYDPATAQMLLGEIERWTACVRSLKEGKLQVRRIHAIKRARFPNQAEEEEEEA